ncbi:MAG TPA: hypothetical protein VGJ84_05065 [Polyangiaceae bacterium]
MKQKFSVLASLSCLILAGLGTAACASSPAAPFNQLKDSNVTAFRLQNFEPPAPPPGAAAAPGGPSILPPQVQQWIQQGAQSLGLQQLLPPGILPQSGAPPPVQQDVPRFYTFRILSQSPVLDSELKERLGKILGDEDNFQAEHAACGYSEFGIAFVPMSGGRSNDLLISFSCNHIMAQSFPWPFPHSGMKPSTVKELSEVVNKIWPAGT